MGDIFERILFIRNQTGLSQKEFAEKIGIGFRTYTRYEVGERKPTIDSLLSIAQIGNKSLDWICNNQFSEKKNTNINNNVVNGTSGSITNNGDITIHIGALDYKEDVKEVFSLIKYAPPAFIHNIKNKLLEFKKFSEL